MKAKYFFYEISIDYEYFHIIWSKKNFVMKNVSTIILLNIKHKILNENLIKDLILNLKLIADNILREELIKFYKYIRR